LSSAADDVGTRAAERFRRADVDGNGVLSRAEAEHGVPELARHFDEIDVDRDGNLTPFEIRAWRKTRRAVRGGEARSRFEQYFRRADANGDGLLSREEAVQGMPRLSGKFDRIDTDRDGKLSLEELRAWLDARSAARGRRVRSD
jgi:Ca2+-binding EF-hand superfamily protein